MRINKNCEILKLQTYKLNLFVKDIWFKMDTSGEGPSSSKEEEFLPGYPTLDSYTQVNIIVTVLFISKILICLHLKTNLDLK